MASGLDQHARIIGSAGARPRLAGLVRAAWPLLLAAAGCGYLLRAAIPEPSMNLTAVGISALVLAACLVPLFRGGGTRLVRALKGARGEEEVARALSLLPSDYLVFHGLNVPGGGLSTARDIDHVVAGPSGLFVIETKNWDAQVSIEDGKLLYNGAAPDRPPVEQVKTLSSALRVFLERETGWQGTVRPMICFASGTLRGANQGVSGVVVCDIHSLCRVILEEKDMPLSTGDIRVLREPLRRLTELE